MMSQMWKPDPEELLSSESRWEIVSVDIVYGHASFVPAAEASAPAGTRRETVQIPISHLAAAFRTTTLPTRPVGFIFMTDFCGSTFLYRALQQLPDVVGLHEIPIFAQLAQSKRRIDRFSNDLLRRRWQASLELAWVLTGRCAEGSHIVIKEWPPTNYIMSDLMAMHPDARGVFLYGKPTEYVAAVFRQPWRRSLVRRRMMSCPDTDRWPDIHRQKPRLSDARMAALHWLLQMHIFVDASGTASIKSVSSSTLWDKPAATIASTATHLGIATPASVAQDAHTSVRSAHSKSQRPYSEADRVRDLGQARRDFAAEIEEAESQLQTWLRTYPLPTPLPNQLLPE